MNRRSQDGREQIALVAITRIDGRLADAGRFRDSIDRRAIKTSLHEQLCCDVEQACVTPHSLLTGGTTAGSPPDRSRQSDCFLRHQSLLSVC